jgi:hypothetical protein
MEQRSGPEVETGCLSRADGLAAVHRYGIPRCTKGHGGIFGGVLDFGDMSLVTGWGFGSHVQAAGTVR